MAIQYRYVGPRYVSWSSAIYHDTTVTFVIRGSYLVVTVFSVFDRFNTFLLLEKFNFLILSLFSMLVLCSTNL